MQWYRVVETASYGGDYPNEEFATPYILQEEHAKQIADLFNKLMCDHRYWKVVKDGYELETGFEP